MNSLLLKKTPSDLYRVEKPTGTFLHGLADFLTGDALQGIDFNNYAPESSFFLRWLADSNPENDWTGGNTMGLIKRDNRIFIDSQFRDDREDWTEAFSTSKEMMIKILLQWYDHMMTFPLASEILIVQEGDRIVFIPKESHNANQLLGAISLKG